MSDIIIPILMFLVPLAWLIAEFHGPRSVRIMLGLLCFFVLTSAWFHSRKRTHIHNASNAAVVRMLGEALDRSDIDTARQAIQIYNDHQDWSHPAFDTIDYLSENEPEE